MVRNHTPSPTIYGHGTLLFLSNCTDPTFPLYLQLPASIIPRSSLSSSANQCPHLDSTISMNRQCRRDNMSTHPTAAARHSLTSMSVAPPWSPRGKGTLQDRQLPIPVARRLTALLIMSKLVQNSGVPDYHINCRIYRIEPRRPSSACVNGMHGGLLTFHPAIFNI